MRNHLTSTMFIMAAWAGFLTFRLAAEPAVPFKSPTNVEQFHPRLLEIAEEYREHGPVDDPRWAPALCWSSASLSSIPAPGSARFSASKDSKTHGQKLYFVFTSGREAYLHLHEKPAKDQKPANWEGQYVVKESWIPEEVTAEEKRNRIPTNPYESRYTRKNWRLYRAAHQSDLFIMFKVDPKTPETDNGWVYGTVTPDGKKVTSSGQVASCMGCHQQAKTDRLFGLPKN